MRDFKGMKRQRSRNRNGGGGSGGGKPQHNANRAFESNGPEGVKVRGAAQLVYEKYQQMARDAQTAGDRVLAENYLQHAEHYFRVMRVMQPLRPLSEIIGRDQFVSGYDMDFEDESGAEAVEQDGEAEILDGGESGDRGSQTDARRDDYRQNDQRRREDQPRQERFSGDRQTTDRRNDDRVQSDRTQGERVQGDRAQGERPTTDRQRDDRPQRNNREDRPRYNRDDRAAKSDWIERDPMSVTEPQASPLTTGVATSAESGQVLRAGDGDVSHAPAFLQLRVAEPRAEGGDQARKPRRRRAPRTFEGDAVETPAAVDAD